MDRRRATKLSVLAPTRCEFNRRVALMAGASTLLLGCSSAAGEADVAPSDGPMRADDALNLDEGRADAGLDDGDVPDTFDASACRGRDVGALADFPVGARVTVGARDVMVQRDDRGLWALELICPHFGGNVVLDSSGLLQCTQVPESEHDVFDLDGRYLSGPAPAAGRSPDLPNRPVTVCNGRVVVDRTREVPPGTRTPAE